MAVRRITALAARHGVRLGTLRRGTVLQEASDLRMEILHPPQGFVPDTEPGANDNSLVMKLRMNDVSVLLTGDLEEAGLPWLLAHPESLAATVLKVPHHGSALGAAGEAFVAAVHPDVAVISVGRTHHLPAPSTLAVLEQHGARVLLTRRDGAVRLRTDGRHLDITTGRGR